MLEKAVRERDVEITIYESRVRPCVCDINSYHVPSFYWNSWQLRISSEWKSTRARQILWSVSTLFHLPFYFLILLARAKACCCKAYSESGRETD